jgi:hypothetical protein
MDEKNLEDKDIKFLGQMIFTIAIICGMIIGALFPNGIAGGIIFVVACFLWCVRNYFKKEKE